MPKGHKTELPADPQTKEELEAARTSTSNKLSGVRTQIKRLQPAAGTATEPGDPKAIARLAKAEARLEQLLAERDDLGRKIKALGAASTEAAEVEADAETATPAPRRKRNPNAVKAGQLTAKREAAAAKPDPKTKTARRATGRRKAGAAA